MSIHIGEISSQVTLGPTSEADAGGSAGSARTPRWTELEKQRALAAALSWSTRRTATGSRHD